MKMTTKKAQSLIEYGLILALVAVIAVTILGKFGKTMTNTADKTNSTVNSASDKAATSYCNSLSGDEKQDCLDLLDTDSNTTNSDSTTSD